MLTGLARASFLAVVVSACAANADPPCTDFSTPAVIVTVKDATSGDYICDAQVVASNVTGSGSSIPTFSPDSGFFLEDAGIGKTPCTYEPAGHVPIPGTHPLTITVTREGYLTWTAQVTVTADACGEPTSTQEITVAMQP